MCELNADRDLNAALNVLDRGLKNLVVVHSARTPVETRAAVSTDGGGESVAVAASRVMKQEAPPSRKPRQWLSRAR